MKTCQNFPHLVNKDRVSNKCAVQTKTHKNVGNNIMGWKSICREDRYVYRTVRLFHGHEFREIVNEPLYVLRVFPDGSKLLGVEIGRQLFAQNDLTKDRAQIGRAGSIFCSTKEEKRKKNM